MSFAYFNTLNYTLANEDTRLEVAILPEGKSHVTTVCGSGGRALPLLALAPKEMTLVDLSQEQLYLAELRFSTLASFEYDEFRAFWGYPPRSAESTDRKKMFDQLDLSVDAKTYLRALFEECKWGSILYLGRWERTIAKLATVNRLLTGERGQALFHCLSQSEQDLYLKEKFPRKAWLAVIALLGNAGVFNALIYKGHFPKKNLKESFFAFYRQTLDRCIAQGLVRENFFLQLLFFGKITFEQGMTAEVDPQIFKKAKTNVKKSKIHYVKGNILDVIAKSEKASDFVSLSDVPSYFSGDTERQFLQRIQPKLGAGARVVLRHYLHVPENCDRRGFEDITSDFKTEIAAEKVQVYKVKILERSEK